MISKPFQGKFNGLNHFITRLGWLLDSGQSLSSAVCYFLITDHCLIKAPAALLGFDVVRNMTGNTFFVDSVAV